MERSDGGIASRDIDEFLKFSESVLFKKVMNLSCAKNRVEVSEVRAVDWLQMCMSMKTVWTVDSRSDVGDLRTCDHVYGESKLVEYKGC